MKKKSSSSSKQPKGKPVNLGDAPSFTLSQPASGLTRNVNYCPTCEGSDAEQYVCTVYGNVSPGDFALGQIYVSNRSTPFPNPTDPDDVEEEILESNVECVEVISNVWKIDKESCARVPGFLGTDGANRTNYIAVVAYFTETSGSGPCPTPRMLILPHSWTATGVLCPGSSLMATTPSKAKSTPSAVAKSAGAATGARASGTTATGVIPTRKPGGWLLYRLELEKFVTSHWHLLKPRNAGPLRAKEIKVFVPRIEWKPSPTRPFVIRQPVGLLDVRDYDLVSGSRFPLPFAGLPKFGVVVHQADSEHRACIAARSASQADSVCLKETREILVGVNDNVRSMADNEGKIELWVRVVR
ncbi:MAG: hypothetical protein AABP62_05830 [Planctomycetota bacterium]